MSILDNYYGEGKSIRDKITELEEENRKLREELVQKSFQIDNLGIKNKKLKIDLATVIDERDNAFKKIEQLREDIDNGFSRETDLRNKRADSLLENKDLRDKIEELETDYDRLKVAFEDVVSGK